MRQISAEAINGVVTVCALVTQLNLPVGKESRPRSADMMMLHGLHQHPPTSLNNDRLYPLRTRLKGCSPKPPPPQFNNLMAFGHAGGADLELE